MTDADLIVKAGNTALVARMCSTPSEPVSQAMVNNWKKRGIPSGWRRVLGMLRPDLPWYPAPEAPANRKAA